MKFIILLLVFSTTSCVSGQKPDNLKTDDKQILANGTIQISDAKLCELIASPEKFKDKKVRVKTIYRYGFESSEFYSLSCSTDKRVWVETSENKCSENVELEKMDFAGNGGRTFGIIAVGQIIADQNKKYGHLNNFDYSFKVDCYEKAEMLDDKGFVPQALSLEQRTKIKEFEDN
jgi:hypothetical protein